MTLEQTKYSIQIEHIWPKEMGGKDDDDNLKAACEQCNQSKQSYIDASDFHYEEICLITDKTDNNFETELNWQYRVALWAKNNYECVRCGKPAQYKGTLEFVRSNPNDSWHFLNIDTYCEDHIPKN